MIKTDPIMDQDITIGQYTLGLLPAKEHARLQAMLGADAAAARIALRWEETFLTLVDALPPAHPPHTLLKQILTTLDLPLPSATDAPHAPQPSKTPSPLPRTPDLPEALGAHQAWAAPGASEPIHMDHAGEFSTSLRPADPAPRQSVTTPQEPAPEKQEHAEPFNAHVPDTPPRTQHVHRRSPATTQHSTEQTSAGTQTASHGVPNAGKRPSKSVWLGGAAIATMLVALLTLTVLPRSPVEPPVVIVEVAPSKGAILQAPGQSSTPGWVVTIDLENNVTLTPQVHTETPADASVQLWTYNKTLPQPRSLGLIDPNQPVSVPAALMGEIGDGQLFEMTLEPEGGSPTHEPGGPILFIGRVVTFSQ